MSFPTPAIKVTAVSKSLAPKRPDSIAQRAQQFNSGIIPAKKERTAIT